MTSLAFPEVNVWLALLYAIERLAPLDDGGGDAARSAPPKLWADAYLLAFAQTHGGSLISFDRALARRVLSEK
jgi:predicted nucleic acid-binding protein